MRKRWILVFIAMIVLIVNHFIETESIEVIGLIPTEIQRNLVMLEDIDGTVVMTYEELPETFTLNRPIGDKSWFWSIWNHYRYTRISEPELVEDDFNLGWRTEDSFYWGGAGRIVLEHPEAPEELALAAESENIGIVATGDKETMVVTFASINEENFEYTRPTMQGALYRTRYKVERVNKRLGIVTKRFEEEVYSSNRLYIRILNKEGECNNHCSRP